jgi:hypothetical protein
MKMNSPEFEFPNCVPPMATDMIHSCNTGTPYWWVHRGMEKMTVAPTSKNLKPFRWAALSRVVGPLLMLS